MPYYTFCIEIFKTLNNLNPSFMSEIFHLRLTNYPPCDKYEMNLKILKNNQVKFGTKSLRAFGPKIKSWKLKVGVCLFLNNLNCPS